MKKIIFLVTIIILGMTSCEDYLGINQDPNAPSEGNITPSIIFPGAEMNLAASYGDFMRIVGGYFAQQYAQDFGTSNYLDYSRFNMSAVRSSGTYSQLFTRTLKNLEIIRGEAEGNKEWGTYLAATTLRVFTYQALVDAYGELPYTEALDKANLAPKYDDGKTIYSGILDELNVALDSVSSSDIVCTNFLFGTSTAGEWIKFAKALKLKLLMRMSNSEDVQSQLAALIQENDFPVTDVAYDDIWADEPGKANPFYQEEYATYFGSTQVNVVANLAFMKTMLSSNDPRAQKFFEPNDEGNYTGGVSGTNFSTSQDYKSPYFCRPVFKYDMPVYLITVSEIEFFKAEYYARYGSAADAQAHYQAAIEASFTSAGLNAADAADIYTNEYPWDNAKWDELIGIQKWIALGGTNNFEAWCEMRRLKYPAFGSVSGTDIYDEGNDVYTPEVYVAGTLYTPIKYNTELGTGKILQRFKYAESSANRNSNVPENKGDATPVFWAE
ncbi:MAG TPA: SusD/RagB family nutrient-binding outer membrane lipoprotein [Bacteroidales bacterium]|nr:SusD/RagB family nutrient-binding outer membrane lipoprotein [Bacteroidales bacterium]